MRSGVFLELAEDGLGGAESAALGKVEVGPVGVGVGVVDDGDEESKLGGVSEDLHRGEVRWSGLNLFGVGPLGLGFGETGHGGGVGCHRDSRRL